MKICSNCVLPETFPGISFDQNGICNFCREFKGKERLEKEKEKYRQRFDELLSKFKGLSSYDALMAYSGGKDSTYTLYILKEKYGLKVLALTFDNGFLSEQALKNIREVVENLGVDHIFFKPDFKLLKKIFLTGTREDIFSRKTLERASTICTSCMGIVKFTTLKLALEKKIPFITYGWSPGQAPISASIFKNNPSMLKQMQEAIKGPLFKIAGERISPYFLEETDFQQKAFFPYNISPLAFLEYEEEKIYKKIEELGWNMPVDTDSNSTNCLLNSFANLVHKQRIGFHPYAFELAKLVREGYLQREEALKRLEQEEKKNTVELVKKKLGLNQSL
ncbi:MAG: 7-cyano-7-deazaguanine synthase [candidate division Zixibacteria bacterium]|nr:7-cyano-7-deazaguanine synthase [candidate division Zixibacteria bacterium]